MNTIRAASGTHVGLVRRRNEDALYQGRWLFAVADGLGGHVAGDIASTTAIDAITLYDRQVDPGDLADALGHAVDDANNALRRRIRDQPHQAGMGTTMVALICSENAAALANVGDSRAYLMRDHGNVVQISEDHTYQNLLAGAATVPTLPEKISRFLDGRQDGRSAALAPVTSCSPATGSCSAPTASAPTRRTPSSRKFCELGTIPPGPSTPSSRRPLTVVATTT